MTDPLTRARDLTSTEQAIAHYREWAERYDDDVFGRMAVIGSARIADLLADHVPDRATRVIDLGCGTGAVGARLAEHGFGHVTGVDISPEMLAIARAKQVYEHVAVADLDRPLPPTGTFGAAVSAGTFTHGHVGAAAVPHLLEPLDGGAVLAWVIAPSLWGGFRTALESADVVILSCELEPVRRDGDDRAHFVIARCA